MPVRFVPKPLLKTVASVCIACGLFAPVSAQAGFKPVGFQWVAPPSDGAVTVMPEDAPAASPYGDQSPEIISPVVIEGAVTPMSPPPALVETPVPVAQAAVVAPVPAPAPRTPIESQSLGTVTEPVTTTTTTTTATIPAPATSPEAVHGFANNVPLAVALRQVLPQGYGFSIDQDVDLGTLVSFNGGRPWRETLADMLQPAGLSMHEDNKMISIGHAGSELLAATEPSELEPMTAEPAPAPAAANGEGMPFADLPSALDLGAPEAAVPSVTETTTTVSTASVAPAPMTAVTEIWTADRSSSLHKVLEGWSHRAGVEFDWLAEYDYPLQASISFNGTFEDAVRTLLSGFQDAHPQPVAELHANPAAGQRVLVVETRGNSYSD